MPLLYAVIFGLSLSPGSSVEHGNMFTSLSRRELFPLTHVLLFNTSATFSLSFERLCLSYTFPYAPGTL